MALLDLQGVTKSFGDTPVIRGIDLAIEEGSLTCLIGASGSGKSTLLRIMNLLEPIDEGAVLLDGQDISQPGLDPQPIRQRIGIVFQSYNLFPHMTAAENVMLAPRRVKHLSRAELQAPVTALFDRFGLADRMDRYPTSSRAVSSSAWPSCARSPCSRRSCSSTRSPARWTPSLWARCSTCCASCATMA